MDRAFSVSSMALATAFLTVATDPTELRAPVSVVIVSLTTVPAVVSVPARLVEIFRAKVPAEVIVPESGLAASLTTAPVVESVPATDCKAVLMLTSNPAVLRAPARLRIVSRPRTLAELREAERGF